VKKAPKAGKKAGKAPQRVAGVGQFIEQADLLTLQRQIKGRQREMDEIRGSMGNAIALAVKQKHLDKRAHALYRTLEKMSDPLLSKTWKHLEHMAKVGGLLDRIDKQIEAFTIAEMNGVKEPTPIEKAIKKNGAAAKPKKAATPKIDKPADVPPAELPSLGDDRPPVTFN